MHPYRSHTCGQLRACDVSSPVRLSGWIHRKRDHGQLLFIDLRDHYGITQVVVDTRSPAFSLLTHVKQESVVTVTGKVHQRSAATLNKGLETGEIELHVIDAKVLSESDVLPILVHNDQDFPEDLRLRYRFLDLRREKMHRNIVLRSQVIASLRQRMMAQGFLEYQTPILGAASPEGARDFLVPSRLHPGRFYALPQAPQQFKQLLMVAGFDRYFQIAPCFRDEDARADRSPGEFYQLDFEMSFATQEDIFATIEPVLHGVFTEFSGSRSVAPLPFLRIPFEEAMLKYGTDKPDLRNPLHIADVTEAYRNSKLYIFARAIEEGATVRAIPALGAAIQPRGWFDRLNAWAKDQGVGGLGYIVFEHGKAGGPLVKHLDSDRLNQIRAITGIKDGDVVFFICDKPDKAAFFAGRVRTRLCDELGLLEKDVFRFCWITDFPLYERDPGSGIIRFSHNPFSMPRGGIEALNSQDPLTIKALQYDLVCNGVELSSGAIRNHQPDIMYRAFEIAGYSRADVEAHFGGILRAFRFGAPPHGGAAPGVDRIVMLLAGALTVREVIPFPLNQQAQDLLMEAPVAVRPEQLRVLRIRTET